MMTSSVTACRLLGLVVVCSALVVCQPTIQEFRWTETCSGPRADDFKDALDYILVELKRQNHENKQLRTEVDELRQRTTEQRLLLLQLSDSVSLLLKKLVTGNKSCVCDAARNDRLVDQLDQWPQDAVVLLDKDRDETTDSSTPTTKTSTTISSSTSGPPSPLSTLDPVMTLYGGHVPTDCEDIRSLGFSVNGTYTVRPISSPIHFQVVCEFHGLSAWTVIQRRIDGALDFYRKWDEYKNGFGNMSSEFWLGNEKLHLLTRQRVYKLSIDMWDWPNPGLEDDVSEHYFSESSYFRVEDETSHYELRVPQDYFSYTGFGGSGLRVHAGPFLTYDHMSPKVRENCARKFRCGWWFSTCVRNANFNGRYYRGGYENVATRTRAKDDIYWPNIDMSLRMTTLKIQRQNSTVDELHLGV